MDQEQIYWKNTVSTRTSFILTGHVCLNFSLLVFKTNFRF